MPTDALLGVGFILSAEWLFAPIPDLSRNYPHHCHINPGSAWRHTQSIKGSKRKDVKLYDSPLEAIGTASSGQPQTPWLNVN